jgi:hypothetical protein
VIESEEFVDIRGEKVYFVTLGASLRYQQLPFAIAVHADC